MDNTRRNYWGTITAVFGATGTTPADPANVRYDAIADEAADGSDTDLRLRNALPNRRLSTGVKIIAAQQGDPCAICVRATGVFLHAFTEGTPFVEACP